MIFRSFNITKLKIANEVLTKVDNYFIRGSYYLVNRPDGLSSPHWLAVFSD